MIRFEARGSCSAESPTNPGVAAKRKKLLSERKWTPPCSKLPGTPPSLEPNHTSSISLKLRWRSVLWPARSRSPEAWHERYRNPTKQGGWKAEDHRSGQIFRGVPGPESRVRSDSAKHDSFRPNRKHGHSASRAVSRRDHNSQARSCAKAS